MHDRLAKGATDDVFIEPTKWFDDFLFAARTGNGKRLIAKWVVHEMIVARKIKKASFLCERQTE